MHAVRIKAIKLEKIEKKLFITYNHIRNYITLAIQW